MRALPGVLALVLLAGVSAAQTQRPSPPPTRTVDVVDTYHGVTVRDPYRWLEDAQSPEVKAWTAAQNAYTRAYFDKLASRTAIKGRLESLVTRGSPRFYGFRARGARVFAMLNDPSKQQPLLVALNAAADPTTMTVVFDPNRLSAQGVTAIDWFRPSPDGSKVAISLSERGSEIGTLHVYETQNGQEIGAAIPRVQNPTAGGGLTWRSDGQAFWYTRYPGAERPLADRQFYQQVYFHSLGSNWEADRLVLGEKDGLPRVAEIFLGRDNRRNLVLAQVQNGDGGEFAQFVLNESGALQLAGFKDKISGAVSSPSGVIFALSRNGAPNGKVVKVRPPFAGGALARADTVVPESDVTIELSGALAVTRTHLFVRDIVGGPNQVRIFDHEGHPQGMLSLPEAASVGEIDALAGGDVLYSVSTYLRPRYVMRWTAATGRSQETPFVDTAAYGFDDVAVTREFATSKDGTRIPINIIHKKGMRLDGSNPAILYGYGGYGVSLKPAFLGTLPRVWLDGGGIYAIAILRGGGEFGEAWHLAGNLTKKQTVFDDFAAAAQHLIERKYTTSAKLGTFGASNGGLLMGATLTQHPQLMRAVVSRVGIYDMLRVELGANGEFNTTEFGSVRNPDQFNALYAYSPYHHVVPGTRYPAVFMTTGEFDGRVEALHSRKMTAALQAATSSGLPVLLRINQSGHGMGSSRNERIDEDADILAFFYDQLGVAWREATPH